MNKSMFSSQSCEWNTPEALLKQLQTEFHFDDDPAQPGQIDAMFRSWGKRVYINPPYGPEIGHWLNKGLLSLENGSELCVFLLPARTDTKWFHDFVLPNATEIRFIRGRLRFNDKGPAPFPSMLVIFGQIQVEPMMAKTE